MDELEAAWRMNESVEEALESRPIFNPQSLDATPHPLANVPSIPEDDDGHAYDLGVVRGRLGPRMPWEPTP